MQRLVVTLFIISDFLVKDIAHLLAGGVEGKVEDVWNMIHLWKQAFIGFVEGGGCIINILISTPLVYMFLSFQ